MFCNRQSVTAPYSKNHVPAWDEGLLYFCDSQISQIKSVRLLFMKQALPKFNPVCLNLCFRYPIKKKQLKTLQISFICRGMKSLSFCIYVKCLIAVYEVRTV